MKRNLRIGEVLTEKGYVTEGQISQALTYQKEHRDMRVGQILMKLGFVTETQVLEALASRLQIRIVDVAQLVVNVEAVAMVDKALAEKNLILPVNIKEHNMQIVTNDPLNYFALEEVRQQTGCQLEILLSEEAPLKQAISYYFAEVSARKAAKQANVGFSTAGAMDELEIENLDNNDDEAPIIRLLNSLIERAIKTGASDVHIEPFEKETRVRMRIDGVIMEYVNIQRNIHAPLIARIKILANLDIAEKRLPQDGKYRYESQEITTDLRISTLPSVYGETVVLRLLGNDRDSNLMDIRRLGMSETQEEIFGRMLKAPFGIILVTGPTGSGKSTTLYAALNRLGAKKINRVTVEDPVEKVIPGVTQVQVNAKSGLTFAAVLRSILRQDPDVIMVGEMRDEETADIGVRAAVTGHLVLSTLHTNDCVSVIYRLKNMGIPFYMIAAALTGVVAQRLVKVLCPHCKRKVLAESGTRHLIRELTGEEVEEVWEAVGCGECQFTGYSHRTAVYEMLELDEKGRNMIRDGEAAEKIRYYQRERGFPSLQEQAAEMVIAGEMDMKEAENVIYSVN